MAVLHTFKSTSSTNAEGKHYRVKLHVWPVSKKVQDTVEYLVDQIIHRKREWGLGTKKGNTDLAVSAVQQDELAGKDLTDFIKELKARRFGADYAMVKASGDGGHAPVGRPRPEAHRLPTGRGKPTTT